MADIYNSRNYSILLNCAKKSSLKHSSTTVEIILYYLTPICVFAQFFGAKQLYFYYFI